MQIEITDTQNLVISGWGKLRFNISYVLKVQIMTF